MINILTLDSHPVIHLGIQSFVKDSPKFQVSGQATSAKEALKLLGNTYFDIIILGLELNQESPVNFITEVQEKYSHIQIIMFSEYSENIYAPSLLKAGAIGYLSKKIDQKTFINAVEKIYETKLRVTSAFSNHINASIDLRRPRTNFGKLSPREMEVLKLLIEGHKNVTIAANLKLSTKTINTYKMRLYKKLQVANAAELYVQAKQLSLI
ncbi:MAG: LuxR C-terminal-related transcriptional regulator [Flavobacteriaceae bacterium]